MLGKMVTGAAISPHLYTVVRTKAVLLATTAAVPRCTASQIIYWHYRQWYNIPVSAHLLFTYLFCCPIVCADISTITPMLHVAKFLPTHVGFIPH